MDFNTLHVGPLYNNSARCSLQPKTIFRQTNKALHVACFGFSFHFRLEIHILWTIFGIFANRLPLRRSNVQQKPLGFSLVQKNNVESSPELF